MKNSFLSIFAGGLLVAGLLSFTEPYHPQDPEPRQRRKQTVAKDSTSDTRMQRNNHPPAHKTDSLPMPKAPVPVPVDTLLPVK